MFQGNTASVDAVRALVAQSADALGGLDVLVNNAGIEHHAPFWDVTEQHYDRVLDVNLKGVFFGTQAFVQHCRAAGHGGKVINISSVHEDLAFPNFAAYCASKGGLRMLARTLAVELGPLGITINNIAPGAIETPINAKLLNDPVKLEALMRQIPLARLGTTGRRRRPGRLPGVLRQRLRHRLDLFRRRRPDGVLHGVGHRAAAKAEIRVTRKPECERLSTSLGLPHFRTQHSGLRPSDITDQRQSPLCCSSFATSPVHPV